jgi:hypothetical protein
MRIKIPPKKIRERFVLTYELQGCQKAVNFLTKHYSVCRMRIRVDGRKVNHGSIATYFENKAYFTKRGLKKRTVLHEFYHHLVFENDLEMPLAIEEKCARKYAREFLKLK